MVCDLGAEGFAFKRVSDRRVTRSANDSSCAGRDCVTTLFKCEHRNLETLAFFANQVFFGHAHILQRKSAGVAGTNTQLAVNGARGETLHRTLNNETRYA